MKHHQDIWVVRTSWVGIVSYTQCLQHQVGKKEERQTNIVITIKNIYKIVDHMCVYNTLLGNRVTRLRAALFERERLCECESCRTNRRPVT